MIPFLDLSLLFFAIFVLGVLLSAALYKFDWKRFMNSRLAIKIFMWIPIYTVFLIFLSVNDFIQIVILILLATKSIFEANKAVKNQRKHLYLAYWLIYIAGLMHIALFTPAFEDNADMIIITITFSSVISDVCAFFGGNFFGAHKLPDSISRSKSYEGILGQIAGAFFGVALIKLFIFNTTPLLIFIPIALGSIAGDLTNSFVKRKAGIKDWGQGLPGHGGYLDRFASLAGAFALTYYVLLLFY